MIFDAAASLVGAIVSGIQLAASVSSGSSVNPYKENEKEPLLPPPPPPTKQAIEAREKSAQANKLGEELKKKFDEQKAKEAKEVEKAKAQEAKQQQEQQAAKVAAAEAAAVAAKADDEKKKNAAPPPIPVSASTLTKVTSETPAVDKPPVAPAIDNTSVVKVAPKDPPPFKSERQGLMTAKVQPVIEMLNKDGGSWKQEISNNAVTVTNGVNKFNVEGDRLTTTDKDQKTFEAMLQGFQKMNPGETAEIKAGNPELMKTWQKAIEATGVKATVSLTTPEPPAQKAEQEATAHTAPTMRK